MEKEKCKKCRGTLVLNEESLCVHCELALGENDNNINSVISELKEENPTNVDCGVCKVTVNEDGEGLYCDVCSSWFHNSCNETPLTYELYNLLSEAPNNVKWFCDKCIWKTESWITRVNNIKKRPKRKQKTKKRSLVIDSDTENGDNDEGGVGRKKRKCKRRSKSSGVKREKKEFPCEVCGKIFKAIKVRRRHMKNQHATVKPFGCTECDKRFAEDESLQKHILTHIPNEERPYGCDKCDKRFNSTVHLKNHKETHSDVMKVFCSICGKGFRYEHYLKRHIMMHNDERPLKCEICGKGFRHPGQLSLHVKYHKKIVEARCHICGFGAPTQYVLNRHIKEVHTNETKYACDVCGNRYKTSGNLSKHKRGVRGSCKGYNNQTDQPIQRKQKPKTYDRQYYEEDKSKLGLGISVSQPVSHPGSQAVSPSPQIRIEAYNNSTGQITQMPLMQNYYNHQSLLLYANSHNSNVYTTQYHGSLNPQN